MKKIIITFAVIIILGVVSFLVYTKVNTQMGTVETTIENWKTYENKEFGYSFKYPERFSLIGKLADGYEGVTIIDPKVSDSIIVYVTTTPHPPLQGAADFIIDGYSGVFIPGIDYNNGVSIYMTPNLITLYIKTSKKEINQETEDFIKKIVSTIKLTK